MIATTMLLALIHATALQHGVPPELALAVARVESGTRTQELRCGPMGRGTFSGPFGLRRSIVGTAGDDPVRNVEIGCRSLARLLRKSGGNVRRALDKYNPEDHNGQYKHAVLALMRKYQRQERQ